MKSMMGFAFFLLFLAGLAFVMLQGRQMVRLGGGGAEVTGVRWQPVTVGDEAIPEDSGMYIQFEVDGSVNGHGGCNGFSGSLEKSESGIAVGQLSTTRMACADAIMSRETVFVDALQKTTNFQTGGDGMSLLDKDSSVLATFVAGGEN